MTSHQPRTSNSTLNPLKTSLTSIQWLKYLGITFAILALHVVVVFYYHYWNDVFTNSLTVGQLFKLSAYSIGSRLSDLFVPLFFFSGALVYRLVRLKNINPIITIKRDLIVIIPLGIILWAYGAFYDEPVKRSFYTMIFEVQLLEPGEKLVQDPNTFELLKSPNLNGLHEKIDNLNVEIKDLEDKLVDHLALMIPTSQRESVLEKIDFGSSSIEPIDILTSSKKWDGVERNDDLFINLPILQYIDTLKEQQNNYRDEIMVIHFTPFYILLFLIFGTLLGYLIPFRKTVLIGILIAIICVWYFGMGVLGLLLDANYSNLSWFVLGKIGILILANSTLLIISNKVHKKSKIVRS